MASVARSLTSEGKECLYHSDEELRLFCENCQEVLCIKCLLEGHQTHVLKTIAEVHWKLRVKLKELLSIHSLTSFRDIIAMNKWLEKELKECKEKEDYVNDRFDNKRKQVLHLVRKISDTQKEPLYTSLSAAENAHVVVKRYETFLPTESITPDLPVCKLYQTFKLLNKTKMALNDGNTYGISMPNLVEIHDKFQTTIPMIASVCKSSDEYREPDLPFAMTFPYSDIITKIVPLSVGSCWIVAGALYKMTGDILKQYPQVGKIIDMSVLNEKEILIIREDSNYVQVLYEEKTVSNFTTVQPFRPVCFSDVTSSWVQLFVQCKSMVELIFFNHDGIHNICSSKSVRIDIDQDANVDSVSVTGPQKRYVLSHSNTGSCLSNVITANVDSVSVTGPQKRYVWPHSNIGSILSNVMTGKQEYKTNLFKKSEECCTSKFEGLHRESVKSAEGTKFLSYSMCLDPKGNVLITDYHFNKLYLLDEKLRFQKVLLDHHSNLRSPAAVTVHNDKLWIEHKNQVLILQYSTVMNPGKEKA